MHTPLSRRGRSGLRRSGTAAGCGTFRAFFCPFRAGRALGTRRPASHTMGSGAAARKKRERSKKLASGAAAPPCRFRDFVPGPAMFWERRAGGKDACGSGLGRCPGRAAIAAGRQRGAHRGRRPPDTGKGPRKTGALADVGLSGPQAWAIPVRAASRKGDQPAGRPARRAPGSCRCCDRW